MIEDFYSLCSQEELRSLRRASQLPPLIDENAEFNVSAAAQHHHQNQNKSATIVHISSNLPSSSRTAAGINLVVDHHENNAEKVLSGSASDRLQRFRNHDFNAYFHFYLCLGMLGFVVFWLVLMLRIYLPESYWTWSYIWWRHQIWLPTIYNSQNCLLKSIVFRGIQETTTIMKIPTTENGTLRGLITL